MKISDVITKLQNIQSTEGDIPVVILIGEIMGFWDVDEIKSYTDIDMDKKDIENCNLHKKVCYIGPQL